MQRPVSAPGDELMSVGKFRLPPAAARPGRASAPALRDAPAPAPDRFLARISREIEQLLATCGRQMYFIRPSVPHGTLLRAVDRGMLEVQPLRTGTPRPQRRHQVSVHRRATAPPRARAASASRPQADLLQRLRPRRSPRREEGATRTGGCPSPNRVRTFAKPRGRRASRRDPKYRESPSHARLSHCARQSRRRVPRAVRRAAR